MVQGDFHTVAFSVGGSRSAFLVQRECYGYKLSKRSMYESPVTLIQRHLENSSSEGFCAWQGSSTSGLARSPHSPTDGYQCFPHFSLPPWKSISNAMLLTCHDLVYEFFKCGVLWRNSQKLCAIWSRQDNWVLLFISLRKLKTTLSCIFRNVTRITQHSGLTLQPNLIRLLIL